MDIKQSGHLIIVAQSQPRIFTDSHGFKALGIYRLNPRKSAAGFSNYSHLTKCGQPRNFSPILRINKTRKPGTAELHLKVVENDTDERFLVEAAQRDPSCFAELYEQNFNRVYA